jgi:hypothetical protein
VAAETDHISLANKNHDTLVYLVKSGEAHAEWIATIAFYKGVHIVEAVYANHLNAHSFSHDDRIHRLKLPIFGDMFRAYRPLYAASLVARYLEDSSSRKFDDKPTPTAKYRSFSDYRSPEAVVNKLLKKRLQTLEQHSVKFLSGPCREMLKRIEHESI